jgi:hypothetical protein
MGIWDLETDNTSGDFMKPRLFGGRLVIDPWGGYQQFAVLYWRLLEGQQKSSKDGQIRDIDWETATAFMASHKKSPGAGAIIMGFAAEDWRGQDIDTKDWKVWLENNSAMTAQDAIEAFEAADLPGVAVGLPLAIVGMGVSGRELTLEQLSLDKYEDEDGKPLGFSELPPYQRQQVKDEYDRRMSPAQKAEEAVDAAKKKEDKRIRAAEKVARRPRARGDEPYTPIMDTASDFLDFFKDLNPFEWRPGGVVPTEQQPPVRQPAPVRQPTTTPAGWEGVRPRIGPGLEAGLRDWFDTGEGLDLQSRSILADIQKSQGFEGTLEEWLESIKSEYFESRAAGVR